MIIVAPCPFSDDFEPSAALDAALAAHELHVIADPARAAALLADAEVLVTGFEHQRHEAIEYARAMPRLRWIHSLIAGLGSVASVEIADRGVVVSNGAGVFAIPIAEFVLAALVMLARGMPALVLANAERRWLGAQHPLGLELAGRRALVIGLGGIGSRVAELLAAAGMRVVAVTRRPHAHERGAAAEIVGPDALGPALELADAIVVCASLNATSEGLLGDAELRRAKRGALLVNVSRGQLVDERALAAALTDGPLAAALIDVTAQEPLPAGSPLWGVPNLWITPHLAGGSVEARARALERFVTNLERFAAGEFGRMLSVVDVRR